MNNENSAKQHGDVKTQATEGDEHEYDPRGGCSRMFSLRPMPAWLHNVSALPAVGPSVDTDNQHRHIQQHKKF